MNLRIEYFLIIVIFLQIVYIYSIKPFVEKFQNNSNSNNDDINNVIDMKDKTIMNIIPFFNNNGYLATYIDKNQDTTNNLIYTTELKSNNWKGPIKNGKINDDSIIVDLSYDIDQKLMCVGMELVENEPSYIVYKKETNRIDSKWRPIDSDSKTIRSVNYDFNGNMIGISSFDGQIYKNNKGHWIGPINYDLPMKKVFFDIDRIMIGIGLNDNKIYKKMKIDWEDSAWNNKDINQKRVNDLVHDTDGKLIATTNSGILKQKNNIYISPFEPLDNSRNNAILSKKEIISFKTGVDFYDEDLLKENTYLANNLNNLLKFKKKALDVCKNKNKYFSKINSKQIIKANMNQELLEKIDDMLKNLNTKGF